jgi:hypothetical protein
LALSLLVFLGCLLVADRTARAVRLPIGSAAVAGLIAPNLPSAMVDGNQAIYVQWVTPSVELPGTLYEVVRTSGPGAGTVVCDPETIAPGSPATCPDLAVQSGTRYGYAVSALLGNRWQSSAGVTAKTSNVTFALTVANSAPAAGEKFTVTGITALDAACTAPDRSYDGNRTLRWSGLATSPGGGSPAYPLGGESTVLFNHGVASALSLGFTSADEGPNFLVATQTAGGGRTASGAVTVTVGWGRAVGLTFGQQPNGGVASGQDLSTSPQVYVVDAYGNLVGSSETAVDLRLAETGATLSCNRTGAQSARAEFGVATYSGCRIAGPAGAYRMIAMAAGLSGAQSEPVTISGR